MTTATYSQNIRDSILHQANRKYTEKDANRLVAYMRHMGYQDVFLISQKMKDNFEPEALAVFKEAGIKLIVDSPCPPNLMSAPYSIKAGYTPK